MAVVRAGEPTELTAVGMRNSLSRAPVDHQTVFEAASLSKPVFGYAVLRLIDAGELALDTPLSRHTPDYVPDDLRAADVTVRHVLSHTTGLPNWRSVERPFKTHFAPGERFGYSGEGFVWLQRVVEAVTGDSLDAVLLRLVFQPLGMHRSSFTWQSAFDSNHADPHDAEATSGSKAKPSVPNMAASLQTTGHDYARFLEAVLSGEGLSPSAARSWFEPQVHVDDAPIAWGLGWGLEPERGTFFQWGDNDRGRFKAFAMGSRRQRCAVVALTNGFHGMAIMPELIGRHLPAPHPAFSWLGYPVLRKG
jgi:CubicO group peptidase (beta-lactamase class C family)